MNDKELDRLVAQALPENRGLRSLDLRAGEAELMENIMNSTPLTAEQREPVRVPPPRRRKGLLAGLVAIGVLFAGAGISYAVVGDLLSPEQANLVDDMPCSIDSENARLVASVTSGDRTVQYWTVDDANSSGDLVFENGEFGGGGCGPMSRAESHPHLPWAKYTLQVDPRDGTGLGHYVFTGQAPAGTAAVDLVTTKGTIHVDVSSPEGYFVALADLPTESPLPPAAPSLEQIFTRVDAYAPDRTLLATGDGLG